MKKPLKHPYQAQRGFTLFELLIAMAISAVISLLAYQTIDSSVSVEERLKDHHQQLRELQTAWWWLENDLVQMAPRAVNDGLGSTLSAMSYRSDLGLELSRISDADSPLSQGGSYGLARVAYALRGEQLIRLQWPVMDRAPDTQPSERVLLTQVEVFSVRFLDQNKQWQQNWPPENSATAVLNNRLPRAVEVTVETSQGKVQRLFPGVDWVDFNPYQTGTSEQNSDPEESASGS